MILQNRYTKLKMSNAKKSRARSVVLNSMLLSNIALAVDAGAMLNTLRTNEG